MKKSLYTGVILLAVCVMARAAFAVESTQHRYVHSNVLGTSLKLSVQAPLAQADNAERAVLAEVKRLEVIFSSYDSDSEISQINQAGSAGSMPPSADLLHVAQQCEYWQQQFPQAFSCRLGEVISVWQALEHKQESPDRKQIRAIARKAFNSDYTSKDLQAGLPNSDFSWDFGGIAKGYILDQAMKLAHSMAPDAEAIGIDIGGDGRYWQDQGVTPAWQIGLAIPEVVDDGGESRLGTVSLIDGALAYSGHSSRSRKIGRRSYSHILTPRDGWPRYDPVTAIVRAADAITADALATALAATDIAKALDWVNAHSEVAALLIASDGRQYASDNWYQLYAPPSEEGRAVKAIIGFSLPKPKAGDYHKPYVALWIENEEKTVVKNLLLLGDNERWMEENRYWWRVQGRKTPQLLQGFARPTRRAGEYQVSWNGRDDLGNALPVGHYTLYAEAAREHGGHEKISLRFELGAKDQTVSKSGREELEFLTMQIHSATKVY